jgi:hypothetical protein
MSISKLSHRFSQLPSHLKLIGGGSLLLAIATLMPWYSDIDAFRIGDMFLGITGPASFVGIVVLLLSGLSFSYVATRIFNRRQLELPVKEPVFHLFVGIQSLFMLLVVNSIYFHPKFGINITLKESRFGMVLAVVGAITLAVGGYLQNKREQNTEDLIGRLEPLVDVSEAQKKAEEERKHATVKIKEDKEEESARWGVVQESQQQLLAERRLHRQREEAQRQAERLSGGLPDQKKEEAGGYKIRMDI